VDSTIEPVGRTVGIKRFYTSGRTLFRTVTRSHGFAVLLVVVGLGVVLAVGGVAVVDATDHRDDNETQHEHPEEVGDEGDLAAVQEWLAGRMTEIHLDCAGNLSVAETVACDRLDGEYPDYLDQYASVERDRTGEEDTAETFEETREDQRELANETEDYRETYEEYQEARAAGDGERSRRLARELTRRADRIEALGASLNELFAVLGDRTGQDYGPARRSTNRTTAEVRRTTAEVQETEFTPSRLSASTDDGSASFRQPAVVTGRLTAENGSALANRTVAITVDDRTVASAETDAMGRYEATYRPVTTTSGSTTVRTWYQPTGLDPYLGSNASAGVFVTSSPATAAVDVDDDRVAYGDTVPVSVRVSVLGDAVEDVPVRVFLGDAQVATGRTGADGEALLGGPVPATVRDGERSLTVRASRNDTAIEPTSASVPLTVAASATNLTVEGLLDGEELVLSGRLTANGRPVPDQRVGVNVDGEAREVDVTDADGRYRVRVPRNTGGRGVWSVTADYGDRSTNLGPSTATRYFRAEELEATNGTDTDTTLSGDLRQLAATNAYLRGMSDEGLLAVAAGVMALLLLAVGGVAWGIRRRFADDAGEPVEDTIPPTVVDAPDDDPEGASEDGATPTAAAAASPEALDAPAALDAARARLDEGHPDEAVKIGYGAVRRQLSADAASGGDARTHWEFFRDAEPALTDERATALERLTVAYERAAFAPEGTGPETSRAALDAAEDCLAPSTDGRPADVA
jgi:hypothetical protein